MTGLRVIGGCAQILADHGAGVIEVEPPAGEEVLTEFGYSKGEIGTLSALHRIRGMRSSLRLFYRFPWPPLPPYHPLAYTVICTSSGAVNAH
jgi:hypothetical protein